MQSPGPHFRAKDSGLTSVQGAQVAALKIKKPRAFSRCGSPVRKLMAMKCTQPR
jgi:hypothetical protein